MSALDAALHADAPFTMPFHVRFDRDVPGIERRKFHHSVTMGHYSVTFDSKAPTGCFCTKDNNLRWPFTVETLPTFVDLMQQNDTNRTWCKRADLAQVLVISASILVSACPTMPAPNAMDSVASVSSINSPLPTNLTHPQASTSNQPLRGTALVQRNLQRFYARTHGNASGNASALTSTLPSNNVCLNNGPEYPTKSSGLIESTTSSITAFWKRTDAGTMPNMTHIDEIENRIKRLKEHKLSEESFELVRRPMSSTSVQCESSSVMSASESTGRPSNNDVVTNMNMTAGNMTEEVLLWKWTELQVDGAWVKTEKEIRNATDIQKVYDDLRTGRYTFHTRSGRRVGQIGVTVHGMFRKHDKSNTGQQKQGDQFSSNRRSQKHKYWKSGRKAGNNNNHNKRMRKGHTNNHSNNNNNNNNNNNKNYRS